MKKSTAFWFGAACTLVGAFIGFLLAPSKHGVHIECGNNVNNYTCKDEDDFCFDTAEDCLDDCADPEEKTTEEKSAEE